MRSTVDYKGSMATQLAIVHSGFLIGYEGLRRINSKSTAMLDVVANLEATSRQLEGLIQSLPHPRIGSFHVSVEESAQDVEMEGEAGQGSESPRKRPRSVVGDDDEGSTSRSRRSGTSSVA
jgi:hypothetical protein